MSQFEIDVSKTMVSLAELGKGLSDLASRTDSYERQLNTMASGFVQVNKVINKQLNEVEGYLKPLVKDTDALSIALRDVGIAAKGALTPLASASLTASTRLAAMKGQLGDLNQVLAKTARDNSIADTYIKLTNAAQTLNNTLALQRKQLEQVETEEGKLAKTQQARISGLSRLYTSETRQSIALRQTQEDYRLQNTEAGRSLSTLKALAAGKQQEITFTQRQANQVAELRRLIESLNGGYAQQIAELTQIRKAKEAAGTQNVREQLQIEQLQRELLSATSGRRREVSVLQERLRAADASNTAMAREQAEMAELRRQIESLHGGYREQIALLSEQRRARQAEVTEEARQVAKLAELERQLRSLNGGTAEAVVRQQELVAARRREIQESIRGTRTTQEKVRASRQETESTHVLTRAQRILTQEREKAADTLARLRAQGQLLNSTYGVQRAAMEKQISDQRAYNRLLAMSNAELMGFNKVKRGMTGQLNAANQSGAMLRATLAGLKTNIGMYTSSTILAAAATYGLARAIRSGVEVGVEYEHTMARVQAIMTGNMSDTMAGNAMSAMNEQVRALGQTTMYTASEVADGLQELGMAGLTASQAMVALQPSLDLAMIGNISMAESADIATNVMMTFGLQARDLGYVVDLMASSITSSNTTISQLANALSYVGPAAESAGFSIEDTVAAVSALSNTGIKASRAGTGLRRMMANLLNPTTKGAAMMREYGITVDDAAGNTLSLNNILKQLHGALYNDAITPGERLAAVIDLVGVRAASAVSALVSQSGTGGMFTTLRQQMDNVSGASERMRRTIQDTMKMDFRNVLSSFQEVQLTAMESQSLRLKMAATQITDALMSMTLQADGFDEGITKLDVFIARAERVGVALAQAVAGYATFRLLTGSIFGAASNSLAGWSDRLKAVSANMSKTQVSTRLLSTTMDGQTAALLRNQAAQNGLNASMAAGATNASLLAGGLSRAAAAASVLMRSLGWVGVIFGIGTAIHTVFAGSAEEDIKKHRDSLGKVKQDYEELKGKIEEAAFARNHAATKQLELDLKVSLDSSAAEIQELLALIDESKRLGQDTTGFAAYDKISQLGMARVRDYETLRDTQEILERMGASSLNVLSARDSAVEAQRKLNAELIKQGELEAKLASGSQSTEGEIALREQIGWVKKNIQDLQTAAKEAERTAEEAALKEISVFALAAQSRANFLQGDFKEYMLEQGTAAERAAEAQRVYNEALKERNEAFEAVKNADLSGNHDMASANAAMAAEAALQEAYLENLKAQNEAEQDRLAYAKSLTDAKEELLQYNMTESELLEHLRGKLEEVNAEMALRKALAEQGGNAALLMSRTEVEVIEEYLELRRKIDGLTNKRAPRDTAAEELKRNLDQAKTAFDGLLDSIDPVRASMEKMGESSKQMKLLLDHNKISADDYAAVLRVLKKEHLEVVQAQDRHHGSLSKLRDAYYQSPFQTSMEDLARLNELYAAGRVEMSEYLELQDRMLKKSRSEVLSGAPTVNMRMQGANESPANELMATTIEYGQGVGWYNNQRDTLYDGYEDEKNRAMLRAEELQAIENMRLEAEAISAEEHAQRMVEIEQQKAARLTAAHQKFSDDSTALTTSRLEYEEQMSKMVLMSMMTTAGNILGMFAATGEEATNAQKIAFAAQQALAVASIILNAHMAQGQMQTAVPGPAGVALGAKVLAMGYASAGLVAAMAIGSLAGGGGGGSSYSGAYDKGGWIPAGKWGVVGEYGPEMVHGPANVTGRERTAKKLGGGGDEFNITLAPEIHVEVSGGNSSNPEETGKAIGNVVKGVVLSTLREQMRPNGLLDSWKRSGGRG